MGARAPSPGQTHPGQVAEPQVQGMVQPVGIVGPHLPLEALSGAGAGEDVLQHGLGVDPVRLRWPMPLAGEGTVRQGLIP